GALEIDLRDGHHRLGLRLQRERLQRSEFGGHRVDSCEQTGGNRHVVTGVIAAHADVPLTPRGRDSSPTRKAPRAVGAIRWHDSGAAEARTVTRAAAAGGVTEVPDGGAPAGAG